MSNDLAGARPVDQPVVPLVARLRREAEAWDAESGDMATLLREAADEIHNLAWTLSLPGFDRMATDEQEAEHQAGVQRVNDMLARMEKAKADHDAAMADAARFRWLDEAALTVDMVSDGDNQTLIDIVADNCPLTIQGADLRDAVDKAMKRHDVELSGGPGTPGPSARTQG
jgi:hypothetical protein